MFVIVHNFHAVWDVNVNSVICFRDFLLHHFSFVVFKDSPRRLDVIERKSLVIIFKIVDTFMCERNSL